MLMLSQIKQKLEEYNEGYKSGIMMSIKESIEAEYYCDLFLKKIAEIEKTNIPEEEKVNMLVEYAQNVYNTNIETVHYKYNLDDMLEIINCELVKKHNQ